MRERWVVYWVHFQLTFLFSLPLSLSLSRFTEPSFLNDAYTLLVSLLPPSSPSPTPSSTNLPSQQSPLRADNQLTLSRNFDASKLRAEEAEAIQADFDLTKQDWEMILQCGETLSANPGDVIIEQHSKRQRIIYIVQGSCLLEKKDGRSAPKKETPRSASSPEMESSRSSRRSLGGSGYSHSGIAKEDTSSSPSVISTSLRRKESTQSPLTSRFHLLGRDSGSPKPQSNSPRSPDPIRNIRQRSNGSPRSSSPSPSPVLLRSGSPCVISSLTPGCPSDSPRAPISTDSSALSVTLSSAEGEGEGGGERREGEEEEGRSSAASVRVGILGKDDIAGEETFLDEEGALFSVVAVTHVTFYTIDGETMAILFSQHDGLFTRFVRYLASIASERVAKALRCEDEEDRVVPDAVLSDDYLSLPFVELEYAESDIDTPPLRVIRGPEDSENGDSFVDVDFRSSISARSITTYPMQSEEPTRMGTPICDYYTIQHYKSSAVFALCDGCSWGPAPRAAAKNASESFVRFGLLLSLSRFSLY